MDQLKSMRLFCAVVEKGSLAAAAEVLDMSTPMATKYLNALETRLGTRLIQRTSRQRRLTPSGENYYLQCKQALGLIDQAEADLIESTELPRGKLKVSAPTWLIHPGFGGLVAAYRQQCPDVTLDLRLDEKLVDLVAEGFDIALRATQQPAPQLVARPLCTVHFAAVASPKSLAMHPVSTPEDLLQAPAVAPAEVDLSSMWLMHKDGQQRPLHVSAGLLTDSAAMAKWCAMADAGTAFLPLSMVAEELEDGRLQRVLPDWQIRPVTLFAVYTSRRQMSPRLRCFIDLLVERLPELPGFTRQ